MAPRALSPRSHRRDTLATQPRLFEVQIPLDAADRVVPQRQLGLEDVVGAARTVQLDAERLRADLAAGTYVAAVQTDLDSGLAAGVGGTPTFFVNGVRHEGAFDAQSLIAALEDR